MATKKKGFTKPGKNLTNQKKRLKLIQNNQALVAALRNQ